MLRQDNGRRPILSTETPNFVRQVNRRQANDGDWGKYGSPPSDEYMGPALRAAKKTFVHSESTFTLGVSLVGVVCLLFVLLVQEFVSFIVLDYVWASCCFSCRSVLVLAAYWSCCCVFVLIDPALFIFLACVLISFVFLFLLIQVMFCTVSSRSSCFFLLIQCWFLFPLKQTNTSQLGFVLFL